MKFLRRAAYVIAALIVIFCVLCFLQPMEAICWHVFHRNQISVAGHTCNVPLLWKPMQADDPNILLSLARARIDLSPMWIENLAFIKGQRTYDEQTVMVMQQQMLAKLNRPWDGHPQGMEAIPLTIHATTLTFYCWKTSSTNIVSLSCLVPDVGWFFNSVGTAAEEQQAEQILKSIR